MVHTLLEKGYKVRGTVRNALVIDSLKVELLPKNVDPSMLELFVISLADSAEKWVECFQGAVALIHLASPTVLDVKNPKHAICDVVKEGIHRICEALKQSKQIKRVVLTSSIVAVDEGFTEWETKTYTAEDYNTGSTETSYPYAFSKVYVDRYLRKFGRENNLGVVVVCPYTTIGPRLNGLLNKNVETLVLNALKGKVPACVRTTVGKRKILLYYFFY